MNLIGSAANGSLVTTTIYASVQCVANIPVSINVTSATTTVPTVSNGTISKDCRNGSTVFSGGFDNTQNELAITISARIENGWRVNADSKVLGSRSLKVLTNCYSGGAVSVVQSLLTDSVPAGWIWTKNKVATAAWLYAVVFFRKSGPISPNSP